MSQKREAIYDAIGKRFWYNVNTVRLRKGMTWDAMAKKLGITVSCMGSRYSKKIPPSLANAMEIADVLGVSLDRLAYSNFEADAYFWND